MNNKLTRIAVLSIFVGSLLSGAAHFLQAAPTPAAAPLSAATKLETAPTPPSPLYKTYTYYGDRYRDPFIPLTGEFRTDQGSERPPQISTLLLKGIVQDAKGRMALLSSGASSYILRGGRLYDGRNRMVKKMAGIIKTESVVIIGADRTVREIKPKSTL